MEVNKATNSSNCTTNSLRTLIRSNPPPNEHTVNNLLNVVSAGSVMSHIYYHLCRCLQKEKRKDAAY